MSDPFDIYTPATPRGMKLRRAVAIDEFDSGIEAPRRLQLQRQVAPGRLFIAVAAIVCAILLGRSLQLQLGSGSTYAAYAEGNRIHTDITKALRGVVYDTNGELLVKNVPNFTLAVSTRELSREAYQSLLDDVAAVARDFSADGETLKAAIIESRTSGQAIVVRDAIEYSEALQLMVYAQQHDGVSIETRYSRDYLAGEPYGHVLGYIGKLYEEEYVELVDEGYQLDDTIGKTGIEKSYESTLRGQDGRKQVEVDYRGIAQSVVADTPAVPGRNIYLGIDARLQDILYRKLGEVVEEKGLPGASAVAIDPRNGTVRALVSYPSYDSNWFIGGIEQERYTQLVEDERHPLFHKAIAGEYPSGSTFKPIVAAAALDEGVVKASDTVLSNGGITINDQFYFPDWKAGGHGVTNLHKALAESVNTYFYLVGGGDNETTTGLGVERIRNYAGRFGLDARSQIDLPGEGDGFIPSKAWKEEVKDEPWYLGDTYHLSIGQGDVLVTPLQIANMYAAIANGGHLYAPHVVERTTAADGGDEQWVETTVLNEQIVSPEAIRELQIGLRQTVEVGSARSLQSLPVTAAGKTGTAQFGDGEKTHSWFAMYAPAENAELALAIMVESGGGSNDAAVPLAREALLEYYAPPVEDAESATTTEPENN